MSLLLLLRSAVLLGSLAGQDPGGVLGYYRTPAIRGGNIVFTSEGDLWRVPEAGGTASRLTTHPSTETFPAISPDGKWVAFTALYEGPPEVYVMPIDGGLPKRCTYEGSNSEVTGWTPDGKILYATGRYSTLPSTKLCSVDPRTLKHGIIPLAQAHDGSYSDDGKQLFFTRLSFQGSQTKRYKGGTAQNIWRWDGGNAEAKLLTGDYTGTSRSPMYFKGRVYFASDRDGVMNIWSMNPDGHDLRRHTHHTQYDVLSPSLGDGKIVYQMGADLWTLDLETGVDAIVPVRIAGDFDQMREKWVTNPFAWTTSAHLSPDGTRVALTARGQVFVAPVKQGRLVETTRNKGVRYREARFMADGKSLLALSDESGEVELWKLDPLGVHSHAPERLTTDGHIQRWDAVPSPDGKWVAHTDKNHALWLLRTGPSLRTSATYESPSLPVRSSPTSLAEERGKGQLSALAGHPAPTPLPSLASDPNNMKIAESEVDDIADLVWSPDSKYLAYVEAADNTDTQIKLYVLATGKTIDVTTDRFNSGAPAFTPDGKFLYFLSDRHLQSLVSSPWGSREPEPFFDKSMQVMYVTLQPGVRSPFQADDELSGEKKPEEKTKVLPEIVVDGLWKRQGVVPIPPGNYSNLTVCGSRLFFMSSPARGDGPPALVSVAMKNQNVKVDNVLGGVMGYEATPDGKKIMARVGPNLMVFDGNGAPPSPDESRVNLDGWTFSFQPREEWRQMFDDAWRMHRDYLYAPNMHGVDWPAMRKKYRPLVDRVTTRAELSDILAQMMGEVSLLHTFVSSGDVRGGTDNIGVATLGAVWERDESAGGYKLTRLYHTDPDTPELTGPLLRPGVDCSAGDVIAEIDGVPTLDVPDAAMLMRAKAGKQMRLRIYPGGDRSKARDAIVVPISVGQEGNLRYSEWEYSRRLLVDVESKNQIGYVHLRAMGSGDIDQWARDFYPVFDRQGLIVDVRHNNGGNIDSWILEKLMRKAWMYFNQHKGAPSWNMQYAFRGQIVVLCDENTASDGEAFSEGFKRLGLGKVIGTRTWGGEVWLSSDNILVDNGIATAAEDGVYGPEGKWLVEGHGVDPDIVIDNLPHETFMGKDTQLETAIKVLQEEIKKHPNPVPPVPAFPDKSIPTNRAGKGN